MLSGAAFVAATGAARAPNDRLTQGGDAILDLGRLGRMSLDSAHQFFGCTLRTDPGAHQTKPFHRAISRQVARIKSLNVLYRVAT